MHEDHRASDREAVNTLVAIASEGGDPTPLSAGYDFYASPRVSPDGRRLAWLSWNHPNLPWDGTELWVAEFAPDGSLTAEQLVAGGSAESIFQPEWSPGGVLHFMSDRTGWWNPYRWRPDEGQVDALCTIELEFGRPQWVFGMSTYGFADEERLVCVVEERAIDRVVMLDTASRTIETLPIPRTEISSLRIGDGRAYLIGGNATEEASVAIFRLDDGHLEVVRHSAETELDPGVISEPQAIEFLLPPAQRRIQRSGGPAAPPSGEEPRRPDLSVQHDPRSGDPVLDEPRHRGRGRELWRQQRLRPRVPTAPRWQLGRGRRRGLRRRGTASRGGRRGRPSPAGHRRG